MGVYTFKTVPFRILTPALKALSLIVTTVVTQVYTPTWEHKALAARIMALDGITKSLKNPRRDTVLVHLTSWYGMAIQLRDILSAEHIGLKMELDKMIDDMQWLQPSWEFMLQRMLEQQKAAQ